MRHLPVIFCLLISGLKSFAASDTSLAGCNVAVVSGYSLISGTVVSPWHVLTVSYPRGGDLEPTAEHLTVVTLPYTKPDRSKLIKVDQVEPLAYIDGSAPKKGRLVILHLRAALAVTAGCADQIARGETSLDDKRLLIATGTTFKNGWDSYVFEARVRSNSSRSILDSEVEFETLPSQFACAGVAGGPAFLQENGGLQLLGIAYRATTEMQYIDGKGFCSRTGTFIDLRKPMFETIRDRIQELSGRSDGK